MSDPVRPFYRHPQQAWVHGWVGESLKWKRDPSRAAYHLNLALELEPALYWAWLWRGELHLLEGRFDLAEADLTRAVTLHSHCPWFRIKSGGCGGCG